MPRRVGLQRIWGGDDSAQGRAVFATILAGPDGGELIDDL